MERLAGAATNVDLWTTIRYAVDNEMNKHDKIKEMLEALAEAIEMSEEANSEFTVKIHSTVLRDAIDEIETWKLIADEFAKSITITQGEIKPKIAVDIERFLAAQWTYNQETNAIQQGI